MADSLEDGDDIPFPILAVAFQPTARGGLAHFTAGNIRIVSEATELLHANFRNTVENSPWMVEHRVKDSRSVVQDSDWIAWLKFQIGLDKDDVEEELIVNGQQFYTCPRCNNSDILI